MGIKLTDTLREVLPILGTPGLRRAQAAVSALIDLPQIMTAAFQGLRLASVS